MQAKYDAEPLTLEAARGFGHQVPFPKAVMDAVQNSHGALCGHQHQVRVEKIYTDYAAFRRDGTSGSASPAQFRYMQAAL
jgi:hypothetical protein